MHSFTTFFLWALAACILWQGSYAKDPSKGYICLIEDSIQNQCDSFCLTELSPRLSEVVKAQNQGNTKLETLKVKIGEVQATLEGQLQGVEAKLEGQQVVLTKVEGFRAKLEGSLLAVQTKLDGRLQGVKNKLEGQLQGVQTKVEAKLDKGLLAVQTMIEIQLQAVVNQLQLVQNKIDAAKVEAQVHPISYKTAAPQQAAKAVPASATITTSSGFELIGTRYFRIVNEKVDYKTAERRCREMGGYLASFRNEEEMNAVIPKLDNWPGYWLGINDRKSEGHFVSVASHKPAPFLKWHKREPNDKYHNANCVKLFVGEMWSHLCSADYYFICQADNET
ncbi:C-type lectin domain family 4 member F-like [Drosophila kikkawai]|uniref:C-type lectin domain family 4 member F-like n=1 Tax=Drosophila kikkawai TaxID=30033 RepID=A0ABM3C672_DROKI|nr:C-type lectin domain family 4 member F-like [Drosophila kikkawai]